MTLKKITQLLLAFVVLTQTNFLYANDRERERARERERGGGSSEGGRPERPPSRPERPEPSRPERPPSRPERPEPSRPERPPSRPERPEPSRPERPPSRPERPEPSRPERPPSRPERPEPSRPERPPSRPERPEPSRPERPPSRPERPEPSRPERPPSRPERPPIRPDRPNPRPFDPRDVERRRDEVRRERYARSEEIVRYRERRNYVRDRFYNDRGYHRPHRDVYLIRNPQRWNDRYYRWYEYCPRPVYRSYPITWHRPMPTYGNTLSYYEIQIITDNLEDLARQIFAKMEAASYTTPNYEYSERLRRVLYEFYDATENLNESVETFEDYLETLYDLFYMEEVLTKLEYTLSGYSQAYRVANEMQAFRFYVDELLWNYRQRY